MLELAERLGSRDARDRPLRPRARRRRRAGGRHGHAAVEGRARRDQGPELRALGALARVARAAALSAWRDAQARRFASSRGRPASWSRAGPTHRTCAFWPAPASRPSSSATAAWEAGPARSYDSDGRTLGRHDGAHGFTVGQRHGLGIGGGAPLYVLATDAHANTVTVGAREQLLTHTIGVREMTLHRDGSCVDAVQAALPRQAGGLPSERLAAAGAARASDGRSRAAPRAHGGRPAGLPVRRRADRRSRHDRRVALPPAGRCGGPG